MEAQKSVNYRVEYNDNGSCGGLTSVPLSVSVSAPYFGTALDVMELAANQGEEFQFEATYTQVGVVIDSVNDTEATSECFWTFYVRSPSGMELRPNESVSEYIPGNNIEVILRYETFSPAVIISTTYTIEYPDSVCTSSTPPDTVTVATPLGSNALDVMERAVIEYGSAYGFSVNYLGAAGHVIKTLSGETTNVNCSWTAYVTTPSGVRTQLADSVSLYMLPDSGYTLTLRYSEPEELIVTTPRKNSGVEVRAVLTWRGSMIILSSIIYTPR